MDLNALHRARASGKRPVEAIMLTLVDVPTERYPQGDVEPVPLPRGLPDDLRCLVDLDVIIAGVAGQTERILSLVDRCLRFAPEQLEIWMVDSDRWISIDAAHTRYLQRVPPRW